MSENREYCRESVDWKHYDLNDIDDFAFFQFNLTYPVISQRERKTRIAETIPANSMGSTMATTKAVETVATVPVMTGLLESVK